MEEVWKKYFDPLVLDRLRAVRLVSRRPPGGMLLGSHRSPRRGEAVEFSEHRPYTPGDDLRQLDWKVFARTDKYYLRQREDETTQVCHLMVDCSGSMAYQGPHVAVSKLTYAMQLAASLAFIIVEHHDWVSLTTLGTQVTQHVAAGSGSGHLIGLAAAMDRIVPDAKVDLPVRWNEAIHGIARTGLVILISDLFDDLPPLQQLLRALHHEGREVIVIQVVDPTEEDFDFSFAGSIEFRGFEGEAPRVFESRSIARAYREEFSRHRQQLAAICAENETLFWTFRSDDPLGVKLPLLIAGS